MTEEVTFETRECDEVVLPVMRANRVRGVRFRKESRLPGWPAWLARFWGEDWYVITCPAAFEERLRQQLQESSREEAEWRA